MSTWEEVDSGTVDTTLMTECHQAKKEVKSPRSLTYPKSPVPESLRPPGCFGWPEQW